jgi:hypothetical protein
VSDVLIIKRADGGVSLMYPAEQEIMDTQALVNTWQASYPVQAVGFRIADKAAVPSDRTFRNAWTDDNPTDTVDVDMGKAKAIWVAKWREAREPLLKQLDLEYMQADEAKNEAKKLEIVAKKRALRNVTETDLGAADTPEKLKQTWPEVLVSNTAK